MSLLLPRADVDLLRERGGLLDAVTLERAQEIVADVRARNDVALQEYAEEFDGLAPGAPLEIGRAGLEAAWNAQPASVRELLLRTADRIREFAERQRGCLTDLTCERDGFTMGHECVPVRRVGCYIPGGRYPLPSSALMTAIPARVAGVQEVVAASPRPAGSTLAAAYIAGVDWLFPVGGAQAIATLAYGGGVNTPCDIIVGPGNSFVTAAKHLVSPDVGIDMLAGPSELVVLADATARPQLVAADLIAQAEHDADALPILVATAESIVDAVRGELEAQLETLPTAAVARVALQRGASVVCDELVRAYWVCEQLAAEHLALHVADLAAARNAIRSAGAVFEGERSGEVFGDYGVGPNHVLPTGRQSRHTAGLSVFTFLRMRTFLRGAPSAAVLADVAAFAEIEGLPGHAAAARARRT